MSAVIERKNGSLTSGEFAGYLFMYGFFCIIPYKLSKGSNPSRYIFAILTAIGYLLLLAGETKGVSKLDIILTILLAPVYGFIFYRLFTSEGNSWFTQHK